MPNIIGTPRTDFIIQDSGEPKFLVVLDISEYYSVVDSPAIIEICLPGTDTPVVYNLVKNAINVFNSNNLYGLCPQGDCNDQEYIELPDGLYKITIKLSHGVTPKTRYYLKTDTTRIDIDKIYVRRGIDNVPIDSNFIRWSGEIELMLRTAQGAAREGRIADAKRFFDETRRMLNCDNCY